MYGVIDVGTTGVKLTVYNSRGDRVYHEKVVLGFEKLSSGLVEQDSQALIKVVRGLARKAREYGAKSLGISVYRASVVAWSRSGEPLTNVITWVDGRGRSVVEKLPLHAKLLSRLSKPLSYILSPDSPAVLMKWVYENIPRLREKAQKGDAYVWTLDSFLLYNLTGRFVSDASNITLTGLVHPKGFREIRLVYDLLGLPRIQPEIVDNIGEYGSFEGLELRAIIADQQSAAVGLGAVERGRAESVHGTGSFLEFCTSDFTMPPPGLIPVVQVKVEKTVVYGIEGFLRTTGSVVDWLKNIGFYKDYEEMEKLASEGSRQVLLFPSFGGIRVPRAQNIAGFIMGLTLGTTRGDIVAGLAWGVALYMAYILGLMEKVGGRLKEPLWAAGGFSKSNIFLQFLSDATGVAVARPVDVEASSRGVLKLLMLAEGVAGKEILKQQLPVESEFKPRLDEKYREKYMSNFRKLVEALPKWEENIFLRRGF